MQLAHHDIPPSCSALEDAASCIWMEANAGSGKTYQITRRVVALLLAGAAPASIWCITYTKVAAAEMRARVEARLRALAQTADIQKMLLQEYQITADAAMCSRARQLFWHVLDASAGGIRFTTIHGLCQSLLASFPLEAGVIPGFEVLESEKEAELKQQAIQWLFAIRHQDARLHAAMQRMAERTSRDTVLEKLHAVMAEHPRFAMWFAQFPKFEERRASILREAGLAADTTIETIDEAFFSRDWSVYAQAARAMAAAKTKGAPIVGECMLALLEAPPEHQRDCAEVLVNMLLTKGTSSDPQRRPKQNLTPSEISKKHPQIAEQLAQLQAEAVAWVAARDSLMVAEETLDFLMLAEAALQLYRGLKEEQGLLDFHDLLVHTHRLLTHCERIPWVMQKLDYRLEHLLVDEAQDTSAFQWEMLRALTEELIVGAEGFKTVCVVGDAKQSIFSFQGASPSELQRQKAAIHHLLVARGQALEIRALNQSRRSTAPILALVDAVCKNPALQQAWPQAGEIQHPLLRAGMAGEVQLWPLTESPEKESLEPFTMATRYVAHEAAASVMATRIANQIRHWLDSGKKLESHGRLMQAGDILILLQRRGTLLPMLLRALQAHGLPVVGADRVKLSTHVLVQDILALIAWCYQPADDISLATLLRSPLLGMTEETLELLAHGRGEISLWEALQRHDPDLAAQCSAWRAHRFLPIYHWINTLLYTQGKLQSYIARLGESVCEIADELLLYTANLQGEETSHPLAFLQAMRTSAREIKRESEQAVHAIRLMTVHGAKGLEAPVVILADTCFVPNTGKELFFTSALQTPWFAFSEEAKRSNAWLDAKACKAKAMQQEYYRLLYVALTRAVDMLVITGYSTGKKLAEESWYAQISEAMQSLGCCDDEGGVKSLRCEQIVPVISEPIANHVADVAPPSWLKTPAIPSEYTPVYSPSRLTESLSVPSAAKIPQALAEHNPQAFGVHMHALLEWVQPTTAQAMIAAFLEAQDAAAMTNAIWAQLERLWALDAVRRLWRYPARCELALCAPIDMHGARIEMRGQIDRLIETEEALWIVDYKTGHAPPDGDIPHAYILQMKCYRAMVEAYCVEKPVRCALLWTQTPRFDDLTERVKSTEYPRLTNSSLDFLGVESD